MLSGGSSPPPGPFHHISLSLLLLLALLFLWVVHADSKRAGLRPVLVLDQEGILAGVSLSDGGDGDAGKLAMLIRELVVLIAHQLLVVLCPADLRHGVTPHVSSQVQGLKTENIGSAEEACCHDDGDDGEVDDHTFPSWMATTSGNPPMTRARSKQSTREHSHGNVNHQSTYG